MQIAFNIDPAKIASYASGPAFLKVGPVQIPRSDLSIDRLNNTASLGVSAEQLKAIDESLAPGQTRESAVLAALAAPAAVAPPTKDEKPKASRAADAAK